VDTHGFNQDQHKDNFSGVRVNSVYQYTDSPNNNTSTHHGITTTLRNGFIEEVIWNVILVEVGGRPLHRLSCLVPHFESGVDGYEYVVPLLVREDKDRSNPQGLVLSKGFIPFGVREIGARYRI